MQSPRQSTGQKRGQEILVPLLIVLVGGIVSGVAVNVITPAIIQFSGERAGLAVQRELKPDIRVCAIVFQHRRVYKSNIFRSDFDRSEDVLSIIVVNRGQIRSTDIRVTLGLQYRPIEASATIPIEVQSELGGFAPVGQMPIRLNSKSRSVYYRIPTLNPGDVVQIDTRVVRVLPSQWQGSRVSVKYELGSAKHEDIDPKYFLTPH